MTDTESLPAEYYTDSNIFEREVKQIFQQTWQYIGTLDRFAAAGDFLTRDIGTTNIVAVRDNNGELQAFHNVCSHRGSRIEDDTEGRHSCFRCPYHGWTYTLSGDLVETPNFPGSDVGVDANDHSLSSLSVSTFAAFVFVSIGTPCSALQDCFAPVAETLDQYSIQEFEYVCSQEHHIDCNWKVYVDNYLECDHCHFNHPGFVESVDMDAYEIKCEDNLVVQSAPISKDGLRDQSPRYVAPSVTDRYVSVWMWPNITIDIAPWTMEIGIVTPISPERTLVRSEYFNRSGEQTVEWSKSFEYSNEIMEEDIDLCERHQDGLSSGAFRTGPLSQSERGLRHFQQKIKDYLDE